MSRQETNWYNRYLNIITACESSNISERVSGLADLRTLISSKRNLDRLQQHQDHKWIQTLQTVFQVAVNERSAASKTKASGPVLKRFEEITSLVRFVAEKLHSRLSRKALKALQKHCIDMSVLNGRLATCALTYLRTLRTILSHTPHLEHLAKPQWIDLVTLCFSASLGDPIKIGQQFKDRELMEVDVGDGVVGGVNSEGLTGGLRDASDSEEKDELERSKTPVRETATQEDIELMVCIEIAFRSTSAPFKDYSRVILRKFVRFFSGFDRETTAHTPALTALNHTLAALELNDVAALTVFAPLLWPHVLFLFATKSIVLKEQVIMALDYLLPFISFDTIKSLQTDTPIRGLYDAILRESENRWRVEELNPDNLRLGLASKSQEPAPFDYTTFRHGSEFSNTQAIAWVMLKLGATCLAKLYAFSSVVRPPDVPPTPIGNGNKRQKVCQSLEVSVKHF